MSDSIQEAYLNHIVTQNLEEGRLKDLAVAVGTAGAIAGAAMIGLGDKDPGHIATGKIQNAFNQPAKHDPEALTQTVLSKFKHVEPEKARQIVNAAIKYSNPVFPQAHHILAIAGIESSFNEKAVSKLKHDPAVGLTQIRPKVWNIHPKELSTIDGQIKHAAHILKTYHEKTGNPDHAVKAYNIGLTNFNRGKQQDAAHRYITKFKTEVSRYTQD